jgi:Cdc6-like AAA superfamily ATPase
MRLSDLTTEQLAVNAALYRAQMQTADQEGIIMALRTKAEVYEELVDRRNAMADTDRRVVAMIAKLDVCNSRVKEMSA